MSEHTHTGRQRRKSDLGAAENELIFEDTFDETFDLTL